MNKLVLLVLGFLLVMQASATFKGKPIIFEYDRCDITEGAYELYEAMDDLGGNGKTAGYIFTDNCEYGMNNNNGQYRGEYRGSKGNAFYGPRVYSTIEGNEPDKDTRKVMDLMGRAVNYVQDRRDLVFYDAYGRALLKYRMQYPF